MSKFEARLKKMNKTWKESKKQAKEMFTKVDAGVYLAQLQSMEMAESGAGNLQIKRQHLITEGGEFEGVTVYDSLQLETSDLSMAFVRREIDAYGYECPDKAEDIEDVVIAIAKAAPEVKINISHSGEFTNVKVMEATGEDSAGGYTLDEVGSMNRTALIEVVESEGLKDINTDELSLSEMREAVIDGLGLGDTGKEVTETTEETEKIEKDGTEDTSDNLQGLKDFCNAQDIDMDDDDDEDSLKEKIDTYQYPVADLTEEEIELLKEVGLDSCIKQPKPKTNKVKK